MYARDVNISQGNYKLQAPIKGGKFGMKLMNQCGFWLDVSFFSMWKKKHCLQFWLKILLFLHVKNIICSSDWLEHTCVGKFMTITFWWVFLSRYTIDCGTVHDFASTCSFSLVSFPFNPVRDNVCVSACGCLWCISQTYWFVVMVKE